VTALEMLSARLTLLFGGEDYPQEMSEHPFEDIHRLFGVRASTACSVSEDLQVKLAVVHNDENIKWFLLSLYYLKNYPKEHQLESTFGVNEKYGSEFCWR
jgi:hypothetical protein